MVDAARMKTKRATSAKAPGAIVDEHMMLRTLRALTSVRRLHHNLNKVDPTVGSASKINRRAKLSLRERLAKEGEDIAGLHEVFVKELFSEHFAITSMKMEFRLRAASMNCGKPEDALFLLPSAMCVLEDLESKPVDTVDYRLSVSSLAVHISLYLARAPFTPDAVKHKHLMNARRRVVQCDNDRLSVLRHASSDAIDGLVFQAVRLECNSYHIETELDLLSHKLPLPEMDGAGSCQRTRESVARRVACDDNSIPDQIKATAKLFGDPRLPINPAEAAGFVREHRRAASFLRLSMQIDDYDGKASEWNPEWLPKGYIAENEHLQAAVKIIDNDN